MYLVTGKGVVIWFKKEQILYGGCFIKSVETDSPGNLSDANINEWITGIQKVQTKFPDPSFIITGHQSWTSKKSLLHTLDIMEKYKQQ
jgi:metallo-beta-lactamase class B